LYYFLDEANDAVGRNNTRSSKKVAEEDPYVLLWSLFNNKSDFQRKLCLKDFFIRLVLFALTYFRCQTGNIVLPFFGLTS
jgi:hypothetical protein